MNLILRKIRIFMFGEKKSLAKTIVNWLMIFLVVAGITEYTIDNNGDMSGLLKKETWQINPSEQSSELSSENTYESSQSVKNDTIVIRGLGDVDISTLEKTSEILTKKFGVKTKIIPNISFTKNMYHTESGKLMAYQTMDEISEKFINMTITTVEMVDYNGFTTVFGVRRNNSMLVSTYSPFEETVVHEYGHFLGLKHCSNVDCIMNTNINVGTKTDYCQSCKYQINL